MVLMVACLFQVRSILSSREKEDSNTDLLISIYNPTRNETARLHMEEKVNQSFNQSTTFITLIQTPTYLRFLLFLRNVWRKKRSSGRKRKSWTYWLHPKSDWDSQKSSHARTHFSWRQTVWMSLNSSSLTKPASSRAESKRPVRSFKKI